MDEYTGKPLSAAAPKIDADDELPKPKRRGLVFGGAVDGGAVDSKHVSMHRQGTGGRAVASVDAANSLPVQTPTYRSVGR